LPGRPPHVDQKRSASIPDETRGEYDVGFGASADRPADNQQSDDEYKETIHG